MHSWRDVLVLLLVAIAAFTRGTVWADPADDYKFDDDLGDAMLGEGEDDDDTPESMLGEPLPRLNTVEALDRYISAPEADLGGAVIGIFASAENQADEIREFEEFAKPLNSNGYRFGISVGQQPVMDKYSLKDGWKIMVHPPPNYVSESYGDKAKARFGGKDIASESGKASLKAFMLDHYLPLVTRLSPSVGNERMFIERRLPVFVVIVPLDDARDPKGVAYIVNRMRKIGQHYRKQMSFAVLDSEDAESTVYFQKRFFFVEEAESDKAERIVGIKSGKSYYRMDAAFSVEAAQTFLVKFFKNELPPTAVQEDVVDHPEDENIDYNMNLEL